MRPPRISVFFFFFLVFVFFIMVVAQSLSILGDDDDDQVKVTVTVNTAISIATTDDNFICATLDWWPQDKCDYGQCPWGNAGLLSLDLNNKIFFSAVKAFEGLRIRVGGTLQDQVVYEVGKQRQCPAFKKVAGAMFGFEGGCLSMDRWDQLNNFFTQTRVKVTFGLNALSGRQNTKGNLWEGDWDPQNAADLMAYTIVKGYNIDSWELGNELSSGGIGARIEVNQYAKDMIQLKKLVNHFYPYQAAPQPKPKVLGPGGFYEQWWFNNFLQLIGPRVIDGVTHHIYNLGPGVAKDLIEKVQDPYYLESTAAQTIHDVERSVELFSPMAGAWVGESGGAYNSGGKDVSHTFANGFWYLDQLGMASTFNHKVYCRQALIGGNYGLLNTTSFIPNPDYYGALLWHRLMGSRVLKTTHNGSPYLRAYAHCSKKSHGITLLLINLSNSTTFEVSIEDDLNLNPGTVDFHRGAAAAVSDVPREEYHLTPQNGNIQSDVVLLNGTPLKLTASSEDIPDLQPELVDPFEVVSVAPRSIVFATLSGLKAPACGLQNY